MSRRSRLVWIAGTLAIAVVVVVILALVSARGGESAARPAVTVDLSGIPQSGAVLGQASAPVEILEFADLQCPFCAQAAASTLPAAIDRWVRPGTARIAFEPLAFIGPDSLRGGLAALAAGRQDRLWQLVESVYAAQGAENAGWLSDTFLRNTALAAGLDVDRFEADCASSSVQSAMQQAASSGQRAGVQSTPTFIVRGPRGERRISGVPGDAVLDAAIEAVR
jgi:protein-disulfide isomerase